MQICICTYRAIFVLFFLSSSSFTHITNTLMFIIISFCLLPIKQTSMCGNFFLWLKCCKKKITHKHTHTITRVNIWNIHFIYCIKLKTLWHFITCNFPHTNLRNHLWWWCVFCGAVNGYTYVYVRWIEIAHQLSVCKLVLVLSCIDVIFCVSDKILHSIRLHDTMKWVGIDITFWRWIIIIIVELNENTLCVCCCTNEKCHEKAFILFFLFWRRLKSV